MILFLKKGITSLQDHKSIIHSRDAASKVCKREQVFWFVSCKERRLSDGCFCNLCNTDFQRHYLYLVFADKAEWKSADGKKNLWTSVCRVSNVKNLHLIQNWLKAGLHCTVFSPFFGPVVEPHDSFWSWKAEFRFTERHYLCSVQGGAREDYLLSDTSQTLVESGFWTVEAEPRPDSPTLSAFSLAAFAPSDKQGVWKCRGDKKLIWLIAITKRGL